MDENKKSMSEEKLENVNGGRDGMIDPFIVKPKDRTPPKIKPIDPPKIKPIDFPTIEPCKQVEYEAITHRTHSIPFRGEK